MTPEQLEVILRLEAGDPLSTDMMTPLGLSFEWFLRYCQMPGVDHVIPGIIKHFRGLNAQGSPDAQD